MHKNGNGKDFEKSPQPYTVTLEGIAVRVQDANGKDVKGPEREVAATLMLLEILKLAKDRGGGPEREH